MSRTLRGALPGLVLAFVSAALLSCANEAPTVSDGSVRVVALRSLRTGTDPRLEACRADDASVDACSPLAIGDLVDGRPLRAGPGTSATLELPSGSRVTLSSETRASGLGGDAIEIERGAVGVESTKPGALPALVAHGHRVEIDPSRVASVVIASDGEEATVTVHRGIAVVASGETERRLAKGQSATLSSTAVRTVFASPESMPETAPQLSAAGALRGLGRMTARVPGREAVVAGVSLARHDVRVDVRNGVATTTVEEVFENETDRVLEGRLVFPVPAAASVSRLALWVGKDLVDGEMVERKRAAAIFKGIVDDTVRPRDPALLEWAQGSELSLKIFPIEAKNSRRVLLTYEEPIADLGGTGRYVYPLSAGEDRSTTVGKLSITLRIHGDDVFDVATPTHDAAISNERGATTVAFAADRFTPDRDFVLTWRKPRRESADASQDAASGTFVVRAPVGLSEGQDAPPPRGSSRVIVLDASRSQSQGTLSAQASLVKEVVRAMDRGERFALLACDSACISYPEDGLATVSPEMLDAASTWLSRLSPRGSSDLAGAIAEGARRLPQTDGAQLVVLGDGSPTSGELTASAIVGRVRAALSREADVRFVGVGRTVDELVLRGVADAVGGTYERLDPGASPARRIDEIVIGLSQPTIRDVEVELPSGATLAAAPPGALRLGEELSLAGSGRIDSGATLRLRGRVGGAPYERALAVDVSPSPEGASARAFARARIDALTRLGGAEHEQEIVDLSRKFFVMSRHTSLLVLENDAMFRAFGIERTRSKTRTEPEEEPIGPSREPRMRMGASSSKDPLVQVPSTDALTAPWGRDDSLGAKGNLWGDSISDAFGSGGLGLSGIGEGGAGRGEGIGLGSIGTIGKGAGTGTGHGFGAGDGRLGGSHSAGSPPKVRMGATSVSGRLPPEVIQRIVRQNFGRFRLCYEKGLRNDPSLAGRVNVSFVIARDGSVNSVSATGTIADKTVISCVGSSFARLSFPQPDGGTVKVTYPIMFSPGEGAPASSSTNAWTWRSQSSPRVAFVPQVVHTPAANDDWMKAGEADLEKLRDKLREDESKRSAHVSLVRGLLARGRFEEARARALHLAEIDPDSSLALDLVAQASLAAGDRAAALGALDALAELSPRSAAVHRRIARGLEAAGDERRACAHWRSIATLDANDAEGKAESLRCRARSLGERDEVVREIEALSSSDRGRAGASLDALLAAARLGSLPAYTPKTAWSVVTTKCGSGAICPESFAVDVAGNVASLLLPNERGEPGLTARSGTVRTVLVGKDPTAKTTIDVAFEGGSRSVTVEARRTIALSQSSALF